MTVIEIIDTFTFYGIDVIMLAFLTAVTVQLFKLAPFTKNNKKLLTFAPFFTGTLYYAVYACIRNLSFIYVLKEYVSVLEHGISVGAAATLLYVLYEQFVRNKNGGQSVSESVISALIKSYVPERGLQKTAALIAEAIQKDVTGSGAKRAAEIIADNAEGELCEEELKLLSKLIIETLAHVNA